MRSFVAVHEPPDRPAERSLVENLSRSIRLPKSSDSLILLDGNLGIAVVEHRPEFGDPRIVEKGDAVMAGEMRLDDRDTLARSLGVSSELSDEELALHAWHRWGEDVVDHLYGDYSFFIWDRKTKRLLAVRDRFGIRPFYYSSVSGNGVVLSDSLAAILAHPATDADTLDDTSVADYLLYGVTDHAEATIFQHIRRLPPGHLLVHESGKPASVRRYWEATEPEGPPRSGDLRPRLEAALKESIRDRVTSPGAVVFMSGGLDSTTLAALAREVRPELQLTAATSVYRSRIPDVEERYALEAARSIGIPIHCFPLDSYSPLGALSEGVWLPEPGPLLMAPMTREVHAQAAQSAPVALHGHPADAVLDGNLTPFLVHLLRGGQAFRFATAMLQYTRIKRRPPYFFLRHLLSRGASSSQRAFPPWMNASFVQRVTERLTAAPDVRSEPLGIKEQSVRALRSGGWSSYYEWAHPLMTGAPIELVYPFSDLRVVQEGLSAEPIPAMVEKHVLRELLRGRVSETIRRRPKTYLQGDPWRVRVAGVATELLDMDAAGMYVDAAAFVSSCAGEEELADAALRAVALNYWLRELPVRVQTLRRAGVRTGMVLFSKP
jgi:asparagine synthase (glutamine-hydrolysing)